jgi:hypothetical protein
MFKKSTTSIQHDLFSSSQNLLSGKSLKIYDDQQEWHNIFRQQVTMRIDEDIFRPLYTSGTGSPNAPIRILVAMMVLKEAEGLSDEKLFENCRFNILTRSAIGLLKMDDKVPAQSTYYLFRNQIDQYAKEKGENLLDLAFTQLSKNQSLEFDVSGKRIRMDSKLIGSNIAWMSRYELIHETLRLFYKNVKESELLKQDIKEALDTLLKMKGQKVVYTLAREDLKSRLNQLGGLINQLLVLFYEDTSDAYKTLKRVFEEQFEVNDTEVSACKKEDISPKSIQSPHDTECHFRNKDGNKVKGYSLNVTESCDDEKELNLIGSVDVKVVTTSDVDFFKEGIKKAQEVFPSKIENAHADGAYHSPDNQSYCKKNDIDLYLHAIQGAKGRYKLSVTQDGELTIFDRQTSQYKDVAIIKSKKGIDKWRIKHENGYRYFTQKDLDTAKLREKIEQTPIEILQKRNNVEATIFQIGYHYPNAKSRYRGLNRHQMWANIRCIWVNFVRILKYLRGGAQKMENLSILASTILTVLIQLARLKALLPIKSFFNTKYQAINFSSPYRILHPF